MPDPVEPSPLDSHAHGPAPDEREALLGRLETELILAQKMALTGELVPGIAHELNNPLAAILGFSQLIRQDAALPADLRENADLLVEEASRTRRIVQDLFDFLRQRPPERHPTAIRALVDSVLSLQAASIGRGQVQLDLDIPDDLPAVALDRGQLQQVLLTLTHDCVDRITQGGGSGIRISAAREGDDGDGGAGRVRITVSDDGPGLETTHDEPGFDAFAMTAPPADPSGLGLWVSAAIVRAHGGRLRAIASAFGRGAAFTFDLPIEAVPVDPTVDGTPATQAEPGAAR